MKQRKRPKKIIIRLSNSQSKIPINKERIIQLAKQILKIKGITEAELSISFVGAKRIRGLNKKFRKKDQATDVLAFSMREGEKDSVVNPEILGDVVICPELAQRFAQSYNTTSQQEITLYLIHGVLHLLGYDDIKIRPAIAMRKEQERLFKQIIRP